jgi:hypothetical protein
MTGDQEITFTRDQEIRKSKKKQDTRRPGGQEDNAQDSD